MVLKEALGLVFQEFRKQKNITQEDFSDVSSRTYISAIERAQKSVTLEKLEQLATVLNMHPLSILVAAYLKLDAKTNFEQLTDRILKELELLKKSTKDSF